MTIANLLRQHDPKILALMKALQEKDKQLKELDKAKREQDLAAQVKEQTEKTATTKREHAAKEEKLEKSLKRKALAEETRKQLQVELMKTEAEVASTTDEAQTQSEEVSAENTALVAANIMNATELKPLSKLAQSLVDNSKSKKAKGGDSSALRKVENLVSISSADKESKANVFDSLNTTMMEVEIKAAKGMSKGETVTANIITVVKTKTKKGHETQTKIIDADNNEFVLVKSKDSAPLTDSQLMADTVVVLLSATLFGLGARLIKLPVLLGYIFAGVVIGPASLGYIQSFVQVETFAQFGVTFLLYVIGMEFSLAKILASGRVATIGGACAIGFTILISWFILSTIGTQFQEAIFTGAFLSMSSTTVVLKCIEDNKQTESTAGQVMIVILIVQDIALGIMLGVMPVLDTDSSQIALAFFRLIAIVIAVIGAAAVITRYLLPVYFLVLKKTESAELWVLGVVGVCLVVSASTEHLGLSIETGAFLAGIMINSGKYAHQAVQAVEPLRDIFACLFFTCIGVHVDLFYIWGNLQLITAIVVCVTVTKCCVLTSMVRLSGYPTRTSFTVGIALAQIGEFAFVLLQNGKALGLVSVTLHKLLLHVTVVSLVLTPFLIKFSTPSKNRDACSRGLTAGLEEVGIDVNELETMLPADPPSNFNNCLEEDDMVRRKSTD